MSQVQALFSTGSRPSTRIAAKKAGPKKAAPKPSPSGSGGFLSKGWFGDANQANLDKWYGPDRALWLPAGLLDRSDVPSYLTGELPGDYGYDPLGIGKDPENVATLRAFELIHCRWAMLGAAGMVIPEGLKANGADLKAGNWLDAGAEMLDGGTLDYFAVPWTIVANPLPLAVIAVIEVILVGAAENYRRTGSGPKGYAPGVGQFDSSAFDGLDSLYPGGPLDPFDLARDPEVFQELKIKEIKNGRLAMMATLGFYVQAGVTGEGPYANWSKHVADPFGYNLFTVIGNSDRVPTL
ncbi:hypothetical protein BSKO_01013 [Bryopsis sp. KO-2023]|nr:hypothetical protein BSKO_01013 [Bryopsis sp. KO-2023]